MEALQHSSGSSDEEEEEKQAGHVTEEADHMTGSWREAEETDTSDEEVKVVKQGNHFSLCTVYVLCWLGNSQYDREHPPRVVRRLSSHGL